MITWLRRARNVGAIGAFSAYGAGLASLYVDAPSADLGDGTYDIEKKDKFPCWLHTIGRIPTVVGAKFVSQLYMQHLNRLKCEGKEILKDHIDHRPEGVALITVSNHAATVDDPAIFASVLPWSYCTPSKIRWSLCSQEYCYTKSKLVSTIIYSAKTLPIKRGAGIDHKMLERLFDKVQSGSWVHIFPEGKIVQSGSLGGREGAERSKLGRLKWGVGKLIARADKRPIVIPIYHMNMQKIMPQDENNEVINPIPRTGVDIAIRIGKPIDFDDVFKKYEKDRIAQSEATTWESYECEKRLYAAITRRIEDTLLELEAQMKKESSEGNQNTIM